MKFGHTDHPGGIDFTLPEDDIQNKLILGGKRPDNKLKLYLGCPVFSDRSYVGPVYPKGTKTDAYLSAYARQFNTVEINSFRYGIPDFDKLKRWKEAVDDDFRFSMKVHDRVTYQKDISGDTARYEMDRFLEVCDFFGHKAGIPFLLLPSYYKGERLKTLARFLYDLPDDFKVAVEFRDREGIDNEQINEVLVQKSYPLILTDTPGRRDMLHMRLTSKTAFIRFAGALLHPSDGERMHALADRIASWYDQGLETVYFFAHQMAPYKYMAAENIRQLILELKQKNVPAIIREPVDLEIKG